MSSQPPLGTGSGPVHGDAFSTATVRADLPTRSVRSAFVNLGSQGAQVVLGVGGTVVLARLLTPADFGLYAMVGILILFIGTFRELGLPAATMYRESLNHLEYSALFWFYQRFNLLIVLSMLAMGLAIAWFFDQPALSAMTAVMAAGVFALGLGVQHEALLKRQMRFGVLTAIEVTSSAVGIVAGVTAAVLGAGFWALVLQFVTMSAARALGCWIACDWRPSRVGRSDARAASGVHKLLAYGKDVTAAAMVKFVGRNLDQVLVGYLLGAQSLGLYYAAQRWASFPLEQVYGPLRNVAVSGLSRVRQEPEVYRAYFRRALLPVFAVTLPTLAFLFAEAQHVIELLLGPQWLDAVPIFRILVVAAFVGKASIVTRWQYLSAGETRRQLHWDLISTPVLVAAVCIGAFWGVVGVAVGFAVGNCLLLYPSIWYCVRRSHLRTSDFFSTVWRPASASVAAAAAVLFLQGLVPVGWGPVLVLPVQFVAFGIAYLVCWVALPGGAPAAREVFGLLRTLSGRQRAPTALARLQVG